MDEMKEVGRLWAGVPEATRQDLAPARAALLARIAEPERPRPLRAWLSRLSRLGPAGALAAGLAAVIIVAQMSLGGVPAADAQDVLRLAAGAAAAQRDIVPDQGQYVHTRTRTRAFLYTRDEKDGTIRPTIVQGYEERWEPAEANRPWMTRGQKVSADGPAPSYLWDRGPDDVVYEPSSCPGEVAYVRLRAWPTDVAGVRAKLAARAGTDRLRLWDELTGLVKESVVRPSLSAALFRVAAELDGIHLVPEATDVAGRPGVAVGMDRGDGTRSELVFDRGTYRYLGERTVNLRDVEVRLPEGHTAVSPKGAVTGTAVLAVDLVSSLPPASPKASRMKIPC